MANLFRFEHQWRDFFVCLNRSYLLGFLGLFRGFWTACGREGLFTAGYMGVGPAFTSDYKTRFGMGDNSAKLAGSISAGICAATLSHPLDTIKTCMQGDVKRETFGSMTQTASKLYAEGGPTVFFRGFHWRTGRMCCAITLMGELRNQVSPILFPGHFNA